MSGPLKFAGFVVGQVIRARDFEDRAARGPVFYEGRITAVRKAGESFGADYDHYVIQPTRHVIDGRVQTFEGDDVRDRVRVPHETSMDFDNRVMLVPNSLFELWTADTVAECLAGVPMDLYRRLWNDVLPHNATPYDAEREALDGTNCLADLWHLLTPAEQTTLNACAAKLDAENEPERPEDGPDESRAWYDTSAELMPIP